MNSKTLKLVLTQGQNGYQLSIRGQNTEVTAVCANNNARFTCSPCQTADDLNEAIGAMRMAAMLANALAGTPTIATAIPDYSFEVVHQKGYSGHLIRKQGIPYPIMGSPEAQTRATALELLVDMVIAGASAN